MGIPSFPFPDDVAEAVALLNAALGGGMTFLVEDDALYLFGGDQPYYFAASIAEGQAFLAGLFYTTFGGASLDAIARRVAELGTSLWIELETEMKDWLATFGPRNPFRDWLKRRRMNNPQAMEDVPFAVPPQVDDTVRLLNASGRWRLTLARPAGGWEIREQGHGLFRTAVERECFAFLVPCIWETFPGLGLDDIVEQVTPGASNRAREEELHQRFLAELDAGNRDPDSAVYRDLQQIRAQTDAGIFQGRPLRDILTADIYDDGSSTE